MPAPRIPEKYLDAPTQRLYIISIGILCQALKLLDFLSYLATPSDVQTAFARKWILVDGIYCAVLANLRIPRISFTKAAVLLQIASLWFLDGFLFGGITLNVFGSEQGLFASSVRRDMPSTPQAYGLIDWVSFGLVSTSNGQRDGHLTGQHTIRMSPISTAQLNPSAQTFCLSSSSRSVLIPILLNNTNPTALAYTLTPLGLPVDGDHGKSERFFLNAKDLKAIEQSREQTLQVQKPAITPISPHSSPEAEDDYDYYYDDEADDSEKETRAALQNTQSLIHIRVNKPGTIHLERVLDASNVDARLAYYPSHVTVAHCPSVEFAYPSGASMEEDMRCAGQEMDVQLEIDVQGVPPLSLRWYKVVNDNREDFLVEGIEGDESGVNGLSPKKNIVQPEQKMRVHLSASLNILGNHVYVLDEVIDALGNVVRLDTNYPHHVDRSSWTNVQTETTRSLSILQRPSVSFRSCKANKPVSMKIGESAPLTIVMNDANAFDAPWSVGIKYQPEEGSPKNMVAWKKTVKTEGERRQLTVDATSPGKYTITGVNGKWCEGDVLSPETCTVAEQPEPIAEVAWERIHECSGDIGVSSTLVLHGTPPFIVHYTTQKDKDRPRQMQKTFSGFRGELLLQPEHSGRYVYTFTHISDANYKKAEMKGNNLSIEQLVHPLAAANFVGNGGAGNSKRKISSCEGSMVDVDVALSGSGPWNLELQVVGLKGSEIIKVMDIKNDRKTINVKIPEVIDRDGGDFEINLVSIEDSNKCKRTLSVPGVSVNVRRVKPTAKFYSQDKKRQVTVMERDIVSLPLRLTGDKPWTIKYRRLDGTRQIKTVTLDSPNAPLQVKEDGVYEIVEVSDTQCPGTVIEGESQFTVDWFPRPYAKLSANTVADYEAHNGSHILPSVCEGIDDHVELELTGKPPFQIMYNIAQGNDVGGTRLLDQPTFNSIQPRTRFQLHSSSAGRMFYEVKQIGDVAYPLAKHKDAVIPRSQRLLFEQQVLKRPSARFKSRSRVSMCLAEPFILSSFGLLSDGTILFEGTPPFQVKLSIKNLGASKTDHLEVEVWDMAWKINLPSYEFSSVGPHLVNIGSVDDASGCAHAALDPLERSIWVDVSETASISLVDRRKDYCVGDISQFQLEGTPPWNIGYRINGKSQTQEAKTSPFSLLQQQAGEFVITSVAHQQKQCKAAVTDLRLNVHPLPSAQVGHGKRVFQDIHEGDQAEIVFTLVGEPPFTFTYQRSEPSSKKSGNGRPGKVLETHTVSRVNTHEYSIYSALEGTWTIVSIQDKWCRYPPIEQDSVKG